MLYFGCESMSDIHPSAIYPSLMAIIEDVMIFNLRCVCVFGSACVILLWDVFLRSVCLCVFVSACVFVCVCLCVCMYVLFLLDLKSPFLYH